MSINKIEIPSRWIHCPRKALRVVGNNFLAFKTPLSSEFDDQISSAHFFRTSMVLSSMQSYNAKLSLWIDLTNTHRYYDKTDIETKGISYLKLKCRGHDECPDRHQTRQFINTCADFVSKRPSDLVGVHCTHGFNRTGFMIVAYLVEKQSFTLEAAIFEFAQVRPPGIYKESYLRELHTRYGGTSKVPQPPPRPDWCNEFEAPGLKAFVEGVSGVTQITNQPKLQQIQFKCQDLCNRKRNSGFPGTQPVSMDGKNLEYLRDKPYKVSWKADGTRYMMLIDGKNEIYFIDRDNCVFHAPNFRFPRRKYPREHLFGTLVDGEMVIDRVKGETFPNFLIFDIVSFEYLEVGKTDFERRLLCIRKELIEPRQLAKQNGLIDKASESFGIKNKDFRDAAESNKFLGEFSKQLPHGSDGLIYQPITLPYIGGPNIHALKWKPPNENSIDFKLVLRKEPDSRADLCVGVRATSFADIKVTEQLKSLDGKIIECVFVDSEWMFIRQRTDKSFPNSRHTAECVWSSIRNPITQQRLLEFVDVVKRPETRLPAVKRPRIEERIPMETDQSLPPSKRKCTELPANSQSQVPVTPEPEVAVIFVPQVPILDELLEVPVAVTGETMDKLPAKSVLWTDLDVSDSESESTLAADLAMSDTDSDSESEDSITEDPEPPAKSTLAAVLDLSESGSDSD